jgi:3-oxoacyl-[acyl-carrier protein] reductase
MDLHIAKRAAAVAASSQGLGFASALELSREGAYVGICSRDSGRIKEAAGRIEAETGNRVFTVVADLAKADEARRFVDAVSGEFGRLDILVTNAGGPPPGALDDIRDDQLDQAFRLTLESAVTMMRSAVPHMRRNRWGRIVNILSITVKQPKTTLLLSNTMRPGVLGFAKSISLELAASNILVNNVAPGYTRTERLAELASNLAVRGGITPEAVYKSWEDGVPMGRLGTPEEFARVVAFLASEAASYVTGVTVQVDGGAVLGLF